MCIERTEKMKKSKKVSLRLDAALGVADLCYLCQYLGQCISIEQLELYVYEGYDLTRSCAEFSPSERSQMKGERS